MKKINNFNRLSSCEKEPLTSYKTNLICSIISKKTGKKNNKTILQTKTNSLVIEKQNENNENNNEENNDHRNKL